MAVNGALKLLVLKVLCEKKGNGADILSEIEEKTGWRASPGSFYPLMKELVELELVSFCQEANIKIYSVTVKGRKFLSEARENREKLMGKVSEGIELLNILGEGKHAGEALKKFRTNETLFFPIQEKLHEVFGVLTELDIKKNQVRINEELDAVKERLEELR